MGITVAGNPPSRITIDVQACNGCGDCVEACVAQLRRRPSNGHAIRSRVQVAGDGPLFWLAVCRQCDQAPCVDACISGALRTVGSTVGVVLEQAACIGCGMCVMICPFGSIWLDVEQSKANKCDLCPGSELPPCVSACRTSALSVATAQEMASRSRWRTTESRVTPDRKNAMAGSLPAPGQGEGR